MQVGGTVMKTHWLGMLSVVVAGILTTPVLAQYGPLLTGTGPVNRSMGGVATAAPVSAAGSLLWNPAIACRPPSVGT